MELVMALDTEDQCLATHRHHDVLPCLVRFQVFKLLDMMDCKVALFGPAILTRIRHEPADECSPRRFEREDRRYPVYLLIVTFGPFHVRQLKHRDWTFHPLLLEYKAVTVFESFDDFVDGCLVFRGKRFEQARSPDPV